MKLEKKLEVAEVQGEGCTEGCACSTPKEWSKEESGLYLHAKHELERAGLFSPGSAYAGMIGEAVLSAVENWAKQGHSGGSSHICLQVFNELIQYKPLTPITNEASEWMEVGKAPGRNGGTVFQSRRKPSLFSTDGGETYYDIDEPKVPIWKFWIKTYPKVRTRFKLHTSAAAGVTDRQGGK